MNLKSKESKLYSLGQKTISLFIIIFSVIALVNKNNQIYLYIAILFISLLMFLLATKEVVAENNKKGYITYFIGAMELLIFIILIKSRFS